MRISSPLEAPVVSELNAESWHLFVFCVAWFRGLRKTGWWRVRLGGWGDARDPTGSRTIIMGWAENPTIPTPPLLSWLLLSLVVEVVVVVVVVVVLWLLSLLLSLTCLFARKEAARFAVYRGRQLTQEVCVALQRWVCGSTTEVHKESTYKHVLDWIGDCYSGG